MRSPLARISRTGATAGGFTTGHASSPRPPRVPGAPARIRLRCRVDDDGAGTPAASCRAAGGTPCQRQPEGGFPECVPIILITPKCLGHHPNGSQIFACVLPAAMATRGEDALFTFCTILTICRHGLMRSRGTICINCGSARCRQSSLEECRAQGAVVYPRSSSAIPILRRWPHAPTAPARL